LSRDDNAHVEGLSAYPQAAELQLRHVSKRYPGEREPAIGDLSFTVPAGEFCVLVGPSGCGKTTTMRLINRMISLSAGEILLGGQSVMDRDLRKLRREIGYVIQQIGLFPHLTVAENIATVPRLLGWPKERIHARVEELVRLIGLEAEGLADRYPAQLSGGQRQRVGVARALAADPPLMLMDEPFGAIDPINRANLQDEFLALQAKVRKTIVFVTHDIDEAIKMGDRIAILRKGGVLEQFGTPEQILARPASDFVAQFVGADRGIKRLSLSTLDGVALLDDTPRSGEARRVPSSYSLRDALSILLTDAGRPLAVVQAASDEASAEGAPGEQGRVLGFLTLSHLERLIAEESEREGDGEIAAAGPQAAARKAGA
jgi:osmoprotectant transport system ATP-binding protein